MVTWGLAVVFWITLKYGTNSPRDGSLGPTMVVNEVANLDQWPQITWLVTWKYYKVGPYTSYQWSYNSSKLLYLYMGDCFFFTPIHGIITPLLTGDVAHVA